MYNITKLEEKAKEKNIKKEWESPTIQDLSINSGTQNNATGPTGPDGGPTTFADYDS